MGKLKTRKIENIGNTHTLSSRFGLKSETMHTSLCKQKVLIENASSNKVSDLSRVLRCST